MAGIPLRVGKGSFLLLKVGRVGKQDFQQGNGRLSGVDRAPKALSDQAREIPRVIDVGVGQQHSVDALRLDWEWIPIQLLVRPPALEESAVHEIAPAGRLQQGTRAGDHAGRTKKGDP